jgi:hypothetical protein
MTDPNAVEVVAHPLPLLSAMVYVHAPRPVHAVAVPAIEVEALAL